MNLYIYTMIRLVVTYAELDCKQKMVKIVVREYILINYLYF